MSGKNGGNDPVVFSLRISHCLPPSLFSMLTDCVVRAICATNGVFFGRLV